MEREAIQPPKNCFGLEQNYGNPACRGCPYRVDCASVMGICANRVELDEAPFRFIPDAFTRNCPEGADPDLPNVEGVYIFCYEWVFGHRSKGNFRSFREAILKQYRKTGISLKMFFLSNMLGWKRSHPESRFVPKMLATDFAVDQVKVFGEACQNKFGAFDVNGLDRLMGSAVATQDFETQLLASEVVAGSWIINYRLFHSGNLIDRMYAEKELMFSPYWLAVEPTYAERILFTHNSDPDPACSKTMRTHRWNVTQVLAKLKKNKLKAVTIFNARERMMPEAIQRVLGQRGLRPEHFLVDNVPIVDALKFWIWLGGAIQHFECLKFVDNYPSIFDSPKHL